MFLLAIIQGIGEFLPISSSAHLILAEKFLHLQTDGMTLLIALHIGTLFSVILYFFPTLWKMFLSLFHKNSSRKLLYQLIIATLPMVIGGLLLYRFAGKESTAVIATTAIVFGALLFIADTKNASEKELSTMSLKDAFLIGCAQILALIPGTSRSGITITAARFLKIKRKDAAEFSMLLSIPTIAGGALLEIMHWNELPPVSTELIQTTVLTFIVGLLSISFLMNLLKKVSFMPFAIYRIALGIVLFCLMF